MAEVETAPPEIAAPEAISSAVEPTQDTPRTEPVDAPSAAAPFEAPIIAKKKLFIPETAEFVRAKNYLGSKVGVKHPVSLYDHLAGIVQSVLELRPTNAVDQFESLSLKLKRANVTGGLDTLRVNEPKEPHFELARAESDMKLLVKVNTEDAVEIGEIPDILDLAHLWEWAGVSLGQQNTFLLLLSIKRLVEEKSLKSVRLWGKIIGTEGNYIVAEGELKDGAQDDEDPTAKKQAEQQASTVVDDKQKPIVTLSRELRQGTNKYVYYVCAHVGAPWTRLGDVIPEQLQASRRIHKYMTGRLEAPVNSYPAFPGNESDLLRCVIARISAGTVMSPNGYYIVDGDEEVEEGQVANIIINPEFEGISNEQMVNLSNWTHHVPYVLPQGRTVWQNPVHKAEGDEEEEQDEENEGPEPEVGPPMLSPAVNDEAIGGTPAWSGRLCSTLLPSKFSCVALRSNRWVGAHVVAYNDKFANMYVGDGLKTLANGYFTPTKLGDVQKEFAPSEDKPDVLVEQTEASVEQEKAYEDERSKNDGDSKDDKDEEEEADA